LHRGIHDAKVARAEGLVKLRQDRTTGFFAESTKEEGIPP